MGTGAWTQVLAHLPSVERLTVLEINPAYLELVRRYPEVSSLLSNPKVEIVINDARRWIQARVIGRDRGYERRGQGWTHEAPILAETHGRSLGSRPSSNNGPTANFGGKVTHKEQLGHSGWPDPPPGPGSASGDRPPATQPGVAAPGIRALRGAAPGTGVRIHAPASRHLRL